MSQNAAPVWRIVGPQFNFNATSASPGSTFEDNYNGSSLSADFAGAMQATSNAMGTAVPPLTEDDILSTSLANWPDS